MSTCGSSWPPIGMVTLDTLISISCYSRTFGTVSLGRSSLRCNLLLIRTKVRIFGAILERVFHTPSIRTCRRFHTWNYSRMTRGKGIEKWAKSSASGSASYGSTGAYHMSNKHKMSLMSLKLARCNHICTPHSGQWHLHTLKTHPTLRKDYCWHRQDKKDWKTKAQTWYALHPSSQQQTPKVLVHPLNRNTKKQCQGMIVTKNVSTHRQTKTLANTINRLFPDQGCHRDRSCQHHQKRLDSPVKDEFVEHYR